MKVKENSEKAGLKENIEKKTRSQMASSPIISWQIDGKQWKLYFGCLQNHYGR